jgi:hypothetical protein
MNSDGLKPARIGPRPGEMHPRAPAMFILRRGPRMFE